MAEFNQSATAVERARAYLADVRAGHVSFADEGAPFLTLTGHLGAVLDVIDGTGSTRAVRVAARAVLAELPDAGQLRCDGEADQSPSFWIARLAAALRQLLGSTAARLAALEEAETGRPAPGADRRGRRAGRGGGAAMPGLRGSSGAAVPASCRGAGLGVVLPDARRGPRP